VRSIDRYCHTDLSLPRCRLASEFRSFCGQRDGGQRLGTPQNVCYDLGSIFRRLKLAKEWGAYPPLGPSATISHHPSSTIVNFVLCERFRTGIFIASCVRWGVKELYLLYKTLL
jgi:hypothetical protein